VDYYDFLLQTTTAELHHNQCKGNRAWSSTAGAESGAIFPVFLSSMLEDAFGRGRQVSANLGIACKLRQACSNTEALGCPAAIDIQMRRTLTRIWAPIFSSRKRIVEH
jgi:hypothetical protein